MASLLICWPLSRHRPETEVSRECRKIIQRIARAWGLTSANSTGLPLFPPGPHQVALTGRNPQRRSDLSGCTIFRYYISTRRLALFSKSAAFQVIRHPSTLTTHVLQIVYSQRSAGNPQTGDRPRLLTSNSATFPLPLSAHRALPLAWMWLHPLHSTVLRHHSHMTLGGSRTSCTSLASLSLYR
jgi:hypothetical protein